MEQLYNIILKYKAIFLESKTVPPKSPIQDEIKLKNKSSLSTIILYINSPLESEEIKVSVGAH
jgi:hypothetical protein